MKDQIKRWLSGPVFEGDQEKTWRAGLLNVAINTCLFTVILVVVGNLVGGRTQASVFVIDGVMLAVLFLIRAMLVSGRVSLAGALLIALGIGLITAASASLGTVRTPTTAFLLLIVIVAGLSHGEAGLVLSTISSSLAVLGLVLAENAGLLPPPDYKVTITQWISYTVAFGLTGALTNIAYQSMQQALKRAFAEMAERKQVEEQLRKLSRAVEAAPVTVVVTDIDGHIEYANPFFSRITGYGVNEAVGQNPRILKSGLTPSGVYPQLWETVLNGQTWEGEFINKKKNGELYTELAHISPVFDADGAITHFVAVKQDITARKQAEAREREQRGIAEALRDTASALNSSLELDKILDAILDSIERVVQFDAMHITWFEAGQASVLRWRGYGPEQEEAMRVKFSVGDSPTFLRVVESRQPLILPDVRESPMWQPGPGTEWVRSHIKVPIVVDDRVVGILSLHSKTPGYYSGKHAQTLNVFSDQVAIAVRNAMLYEEVQNLAIVDELTDLYNRRGFYEVCRREVGRLQRYNRPLSILFLDVDHFKQFNDRYSYEVGDQVLKLVAKTLKRNVREIDVVGRYGGEEMVILLPEIDQASAVEAAERLRAQIEKLRVSSGQGEIGVTASIGVAALAPVQEQALAAEPAAQITILNDLIARAGHALHVAKQQGRNQVAACG